MARRGQFKKGGGRVGYSSHSRRSTSTALVRRSRGPVVIRETKVVRAKRRHGHHGGAGGAFSGAGKHGLVVKGELAGWASLLGYLETNKADTFEKIPTFGKLPREAVVGLVLHMFGRKHKHVDRASAAALAVAGYKFGANGYSLSGFEE